MKKYCPKVFPYLMTYVDFSFLPPFVNDLRIKPYLLTRQPLTRAIGYGVPSLVEPETNPKEEIKAKYPLGLENAKQTLQPIVQ